MLGIYIWVYLKNDYFLLNIVLATSAIYIVSCFLPTFFENIAINKYNNKKLEQYNSASLLYEEALKKSNTVTKQTSSSLQP